MSKKKTAATIVVPSDDPDKQKDKTEGSDDEVMRDASGDGGEDAPAALRAANKLGEEEESMSAEDKELKDNLEMLVARVTEDNPDLEFKLTAVEAIKDIVRSATSSMTSVPKPLKFLRPHYEDLAAYYERIQHQGFRIAFGDLMSVLSITMSKGGKRRSLQYVLEGRRMGLETELGSWGHEYVRNLTKEIGQEWAERLANAEDESAGADAEAAPKPTDTSELLQLVKEILPYFVEHNVESDAVDLMMEVDRLDDMPALVTKANHVRFCSYLLACTQYAADNEEMQKQLHIIYECYMKVEEYCGALRIALRLNDGERISQTFAAAAALDKPTLTKQLGFILAASRYATDEFEDEDDELNEIIGNVHLSEQYHFLAQELDVQAPKHPDDIYKMHLVEGNPLRPRTSATGAKVDSAKQNLAATFVSAFVNAGFGTDKLLTPEGSEWLYKNKDHGMLSAAASLGMVMLWDLETGFSAVDKYSFSQQAHIKAGALLATGIVSSGVTSEMDAALALLSEVLEDEASPEPSKVAASLGLGLAYAGTARDDVREYLVPIIVDGSNSLEVSAIAALALGMVYVGTADEEISGDLLAALMERSETGLEDSTSKLFCLGVAFLFMGCGEDCEAALMVVDAMEHPIKRYFTITIESMAYAGTGNVLTVQKLLAECTERFPEGEDEEEDKDKDKDGEKKTKSKLDSVHQQAAAVGLALVTMGESLGQEMILRSLDHILQCGEVNLRRAIPLALALNSISNPQITIMETLSKLSHDSDELVSQNAILALGFIGAGTNNSRIANMLRQLSGYYAKEPNHLFLVRIAQGLLHMGKGLMTIDPSHADGNLISRVGLVGILTVLHSAFDMKESILSKRHYLLFALVTAMRPRMLLAVDEDLEPVAVKVRVGQALDTVGQAGKPKRITGFQTHNTPVLISHGERAEFDNDEYVAHTDLLEGCLIVEKNPDAEQAES